MCADVSIGPNTLAFINNTVSGEMHDAIVSYLQKTCASSCWKRRTRVRPAKAPLYSLRCNTPKSASRNGSSLYDLVLFLNKTQ